MTRKDYVLITEAFHAQYNASAIRERSDWQQGHTQGVMDAAIELSNYIHRSNPHFDRERFLNAVRESF